LGNGADTSFHRTYSLFLVFTSKCTKCVWLEITVLSRPPAGFRGTKRGGTQREGVERKGRPGEGGRRREGEKMKG